jgi:hypothetical protein
MPVPPPPAKKRWWHNTWLSCAEVDTQADIAADDDQYIAPFIFPFIPSSFPIVASMDFPQILSSYEKRQCLCPIV